MNQFPPVIFDAIRWIAGSLMAACVLLGLFLGILIALRQSGTPLTKRLFSFLLLAFSLTLLNNFLAYWGVFNRHPRYYFLPIYFSLSLGPLLFFYVKSQLYPAMQLRRNDSKHFIMPIVQLVIFLMIGFRSLAFKSNIRQHFFSPVYGSFEDALYLVTFFMYCYFAYRFIKHEIAHLQAHRNRRYRLILGWQKRMVKVLFMLFFVNAAYIITDYVSYRYFDINLNNKALFSAYGELSFAAMLFWLSLNAWFALRRGL